MRMSSRDRLKSFKVRLHEGAVSGLSLLPSGLLETAEGLAASANGKGWGSFSVSREVTACLRLAGTPSDHTVFVLDIGANVGNWSAALLRARKNSRIVAFEPSPQAFETLSARFQSCSQITAVQHAVSRSVGTAVLYADCPGSGLGSLHLRDVSHHGIAFQHHVEVTTVSVDDWCRERALTPDIMKLDVEGHELDVLHGAIDTLARGIRVVQFEFGGCNIDSRTYFRDFWDLFRQLRFAHIYRVTPSRLVRINRYSESLEEFRTTNFIAVR
jgi:FkbM family methyltransferase